MALLSPGPEPATYHEDEHEDKADAHHYGEGHEVKLHIEGNGVV